MDVLAIQPSGGVARFVGRLRWSGCGGRRGRGRGGGLPSAVETGRGVDLRLRVRFRGQIYMVGDAMGHSGPTDYKPRGPVIGRPREHVIGKMGLG